MLVHYELMVHSPLVITFGGETTYLIGASQEVYLLLLGKSGKSAFGAFLEPKMLNAAQYHSKKQNYQMSV